MTHQSKLPANGTFVRFSIVPTGSYAKPNEEYEVTREGRYIHLRSVERGSATSDKTWAYKNAKWEYTECHLAGDTVEAPGWDV